MGAYFVAAVTAYLSKRNPYTHAIWALFGTVTLLGMLGAFQNVDFLLKYRDDDAFIMSGFAAALGILVYELFRMREVSLTSAWSPQGPFRIWALVGALGACVACLLDSVLP